MLGWRGLCNTRRGLYRVATQHTRRGLYSAQHATLSKPSARATSGHMASRAATTTAATSSQNGYSTLEHAVQVTTEVKKSKFIATAWPISSAPEALSLIQDAAAKDASHNCWAYSIGDEFRSSDDGEPAGTAGRPILSAIQGEGLDATCVLVTRYFGGIKLGAGGLVRAYGAAARECLRAAPKVFRRARVTLELQLPYKSLGAVYGQLDRFHACRMGDEEYLDDGSVRIMVALDSDCESGFVSAVSDLTAGAVVPKRAA